MTEKKFVPIIPKKEEKIDVIWNFPVEGRYDKVKRKIKVKEVGEDMNKTLIIYDIICIFVIIGGMLQIIGGNLLGIIPILMGTIIFGYVLWMILKYYSKYLWLLIMLILIGTILTFFGNNTMDIYCKYTYGSNSWFNETLKACITPITGG